MQLVWLGEKSLAVALVADSPPLSSGPHLTLWGLAKNNSNKKACMKQLEYRDCRADYVHWKRTIRLTQVFFFRNLQNPLLLNLKFLLCHQRIIAIFLMSAMHYRTNVKVLATPNDLQFCIFLKIAYNYRLHSQIFINPLCYTWADSGFSAVGRLATSV